MTDKINTTKVQDSSKSSAEGKTHSAGSADFPDEVLSLKSLDKIIADEDPDFARSLKTMNSDLKNIQIYNESVKSAYDADDEVMAWLRSGGLKWIVATVLPFVPRIAFKAKTLRTRLRLALIKWSENFIDSLIHAGPYLLNWAKKKIKNAIAASKTKIIEFKSFSKIKKALFAGLLLATVGSGYVINKLVHHKFFPPERELFTLSIEELSQETIQIEPEDTFESFYDSTRAAQNILNLRKMMVNLKASENSGPNPMGAFEFFLEGTVSEVLIEIKDREIEVVDLLSRKIEEYTYDQLSSGEGKKLLCEHLQKEINKILTQGRVRRVFIKTVIIKP